MIDVIIQQRQTVAVCPFKQISNSYGADCYQWLFLLMDYNCISPLHGCVMPCLQGSASLQPSSRHRDVLSYHLRVPVFAFVWLLCGLGEWDGGKAGGRRCERNRYSHTGNLAEGALRLCRTLLARVHTCTHTHTHTPLWSVAPFSHIMRPNMINAVHSLFFACRGRREAKWSILCPGAFTVKSDEALTLWRWPVEVILFSKSTATHWGGKNRRVPVRWRQCAALTSASQGARASLRFHLPESARTFVFALHHCKMCVRAWVCMCARVCIGCGDEARQEGRGGGWAALTTAYRVRYFTLIGHFCMIVRC